MAVVLITALWSNFRDNPIIVSFAPFETTLDDIPFPAVTICNMNKVQKSDALALIKSVLFNAQIVPQHPPETKNYFYFSCANRKLEDA